METLTMDRKIQKKKWTIKKIISIISIIAVLIILGYLLIFSSDKSSLNVNTNTITISNVKREGFLEYIPVSGIVTPSKSIFLDAIEGGNIKNVFKESGTIVEEGDLLIELSNSKLELDVMNREAQLYEQVNLMRNTRLALDQNNLNQKAQLMEIQYQLNILKPQYEKYFQLLEKNMISAREYELTKEQYEFNLKRNKIMSLSYFKDSISRNQQIRQLEISENRINRNLEAVQQILENLRIRAPFKGQLSTIDLQIGQSVKVGERMGQVDLVGRYKLKVPIDELYLSRISENQKGTVDFSGKTYKIAIRKIYPNILKGKFEVDMEFENEIPIGLKRGLTLTIKIELNQSEEALLLPTGGFYRSTGGNWIYIIDQSGKKAIRREIKLGRKNPNHYEVIQGLSVGDKVITSSYDNFGDKEILNLND